MVNLNYKQMINEKIINSFSDLLSEIIFIYYENKKEITKKKILSELPSIREFKKTEVDTIYSNAIELVKEKYNIEI